MVAARKARDGKNDGAPGGELLHVSPCANHRSSGPIVLLSAASFASVSRSHGTAGFAR
jgi:hypothetical protein